LMMSLWDALRMNMMISYQELVRTFLRKIPGICWRVMQFAYQMVNFCTGLVGSERTFPSE
ncbi:hypothetical protein, partial [Escherichia coli]|uniref:hypothetical protein n=1 Tax=Escherichia coli TaxID=562 RepID=UPI0021125EC5